MPNRMVRDDLLTSERYWACSPEARNLYVSILLSADDCARYTASNFALRTKCMAGTVTAERIEKLLAELLDADLIRLYDADGARYLFVPRFRQRLRYTNSRYPAPPSGINDLPGIKTVSSQPQASPKTAEVKRSEEKRSKEPMSGKPDAMAILEFLNEKAGREYQPVAVNLEKIEARLREGYTVADLRQIVAKKCRDWGADDKMRQYLRPATLFNREKAAQYRGELVTPKETHEG